MIATLSSLTASFLDHDQAATKSAAASRAVKIARGKVRNRVPHERDAGVFAGHAFLHARDLHPGRSSSIRKLQRAFRIAGRSFTPGRG